MQYITTSLLSSFKYWKESEKPIEEFLDCLRKIRTPPTEAMQRGIDFEDTIKAISDGVITDTNNYKKVFIDISNIVKGGLWQQVVKKTIKVNGQELMLYGKADVIKGNTIYDIKTTKVYQLGKYNTSTQHLIYMYCTGIKNFEYLIAQGGVNLENFYRESYNMKSDNEIKLRGIIAEFLGFLDNYKEAKKIYFEKWKYNKG